MPDEDDDGSENEVSITLAIDAMYYREAMRMSELASAKDKEFVESQSAVAAAEQDMLNYMNDPARDPDDDGDDDVFNDLNDELNRSWEPVNLAATELIRAAATAHILCAACLEAHINMQAERVLQRRDFDEFDKLAITGKWLFYPVFKEVGKRFDPGREPYQGFQRLIKRRNALLHFKVKRVKTFNPFTVPSFVEELGLRAAATTESLSAARGMIVTLAEMEQREVPEWIDGDSCSAFEYEWKNSS
jgi:hypothetical protein